MAFHLVVLFGTKLSVPANPPEFDGFDQGWQTSSGKDNFRRCRRTVRPNRPGNRKQSLNGAAHRSPNSEAFLMA